MAAPKDRSTQQIREKKINIAAFAVFSFVPYSLFFVAMTAAEDILAGTDLPTATVYLCSVIPYSLAILVLPIFADKVPHVLMMLLTFGFDTFGIIFLAVLGHRNAKLVGVCMISLANSFGDVGFLSMTALYGEVTVNAYVAGTAIGFGLAVTYYAAVTTWLCVSVNVTLMIITWLPLLLPIFYCLMDKTESGDQRLVSKPTTYEDVPYIPINTESREKEVKQVQLTCRDKLSIAWKEMPLLISFYIGVCGKLLVMQALATTLAFSNAPFEPRDHYQYYVFAIMCGDVIGASCGLIVYCLKCTLPSHTRHTWIFASLITASVIFLVFASWFRFLHHVWSVICICFFIGLNHGVLYNCTFASAVWNTSASHKAFARAFLTAGMGLGALSASLLGLYIEPLLKEHCLNISKYPADCLTRLMQRENDKCLFN